MYTYLKPSTCSFSDAQWADLAALWQAACGTNFPAL